MIKNWRARVRTHPKSSKLQTDERPTTPQQTRRPYLRDATASCAYELHNLVEPLALGPDIRRHGGASTAPRRLRRGPRHRHVGASADQLAHGRRPA
eukprot:scaffold3551_cov118-Isochrysis_galbana.AAC.3